MKYISAIIFLLVFIFSCNNAQKTNAQNDSASDTIVSVSDTVQTVCDEVDANKLTINPQPIKVAGRWRNKETIDTLYISLYSRKLNKEIASPLFFIDKCEYDRLVGFAVELDPIVYIFNNNNPTDTLKIENESGQLFGLYFAVNEGDLDGDGLDELLYMVDWADWSSTNTFHIASYKNNKWIDLYSFPVWEWQFDEGYEKVIQKLPENKIMINFKNDEAMEETKIVDLSKLGK
mgnify:CR=1 FL=1